MATVITNGSDSDHEQRNVEEGQICTAATTGPRRVVAVDRRIRACADGPTSPSDTAVVTFGVAGETFRVQLVGERQIEAARAAQGGGPARIPNGRIVPGVGVNSGWSWHLEDVEFVEVAIELCDGRPSDIERQGMQFGGGRFCPWGARVLAITD